MKKTSLLIIGILSFTVNAMSQVEGDVRSKDNKRIPNAVIIALDTTNKIIDSVFSADDGFYSFETLKAGIYTIVAKVIGFENRVYKKIIAREKLVNKDAGSDISNATRLQIVLTPLKPPK
jgi:uncharacterized membrane protein